MYYCIIKLLAFVCPSLFEQCLTALVTCPFNLIFYCKMVYSIHPKREIRKKLQLLTVIYRKLKCKFTIEDI